MKKLLCYMKGYGRECVLGPLFKLLEASFELIVPLIVAAIIDRGILAGDRGYIVRMCLVMAALGAVGLISAVTAQYFAAKAAISFSARLRHALMAHIGTLSYTEIDRLGTSTLITRMTSDVNQVQSGVNMTLRLLLRSPFVVFGAMIMAFTIDAGCALIFAGVIAVLCAIVFGIMLATIPMYRRVQGQLDSVTASTRENLTGVRVIRAFCKEGAETEKFDRKNRLLTRMQLAVGRVSAAMNPVTYVVINAAVILLIHAGAIRVQQGTLTQGEVVALYNYMSQILVELVKMANLIILLTKAAACGERISRVLDVKTSQRDGTLAPAGDAPRGSVVFDRVSMHYSGAGADSLTNISFSAQPGQTVGVIGGTGSGKSTLVNLIPRFYDVSEGGVWVDGVDVRDMRKDELRRRIAVVPQKAVLFKGTIRSNLLWGNESATEEDLHAALSTAQALDVVSAKPLGLDEPVEQGGRNFSGGQRQRLTIARALVKKPEILILDDSASALDYATDANLRRAIRQMENPPTTFIVSQRAASVRFADLIVVLEDGHVAGMGTHEELLRSCPVYQEIFSSQFKSAAAAGKEVH
ncbi:MAG: ABC transporter ATP-binding protein [Clostridia bacterium]|nr:ABC transporter ATP-binding protein [Clostridia bacterium]